MIVSVIFFIKELVSKRRATKQINIPNPPKYHASFDRRVEEREFAGVIWRILVGSNVEPDHKLSREFVYAWPFPRAHCPECDYELERKRIHWYCMPCKKKYKIPRELRKNTWEKVRRNYQRLVVQYGCDNFGIAEDNHKPLRVVLRNMKKDQEERKK